MNYKRCFALIFSMLMMFGSGFSCASQSGENYSIINFLSVGEGDATIISLPDGKVLMIDCAPKSYSNYEKIKEVLKVGNGTIDYFILTHPDSQHYGNALSIIDDYEIKNAYIPLIKDKTLFRDFSTIETKLNDECESVNISYMGQRILGEDYSIVFLMPEHYNSFGSSYFEFNTTEEPTASMVDNLSPIIYMDICGVRFMFNGDSLKSQDKQVALSFNANIFKAIKDVDIEFGDMDFLMVSSHGSSSASDEYYLQTLTAKNAIISCGYNPYSNPSTALLVRLVEANSSVNIWRTDVYGDIKVNINKDGSYRMLFD